VNGAPALERFVISGFPVDEFGKDLDARFKIEAERGLILKANVDDVVIRRDGEFHLSDDLAFGLRELENSLICFISSTGADSLRDSHLALHER
jgi:hypothetical protein